MRNRPREIRRHKPEVLVIYDPFGGYGHPDHINVHRIGLAAYTGCIDRVDAPDRETDLFAGLR
jgi:hypothetical protein